jgi:hypothetical protein
LSAPISAYVRWNPPTARHDRDEVRLVAVDDANGRSLEDATESSGALRRDEDLARALRALIAQSALRSGVFTPAARMTA